MRHYFIKEEIGLENITINLYVVLKYPKKLQNFRFWLVGKILGIPIKFNIRKKIFSSDPYLEKVEDLTEKDYENDGEENDGEVHFNG